MSSSIQPTSYRSIRSLKPHIHIIGTAILFCVGLLASAYVVGEGLLTYDQPARRPLPAPREWTLHERVDFYVGDLQRMPIADIVAVPKIFEMACVTRVDGAITEEDLEKELRNHKGIPLTIMRDMLHLYTTCGLDSKTSFLVVHGDARRSYSSPICGSKVHGDHGLPHMTKVRLSGERRGVILPFQTTRHWRNILPESLVPWELKKEALVWRGTTSGTKNGETSRKTIVDALCRDHDVGFSSISSDRAHWVTEECPLKPRLSRKELMEYKYILDIEGNDVSTSLKWMLAHNSVVVMPTPTISSWLMEQHLEPWVHYVPLDDLEEIEQLLQWMRTHDTRNVDR